MSTAVATSAAQQFTAEQVGHLRAGDFIGTIGDPLARRRFDRYNRSESMLTKHREAGGPLAYLDAFIDEVRASGTIHEPVQIDADGAIYDGHHRAMAAHALGIGLPWVHVQD